MSELLAICTAAGEDSELLTGIAAHRPERVTVLIEDADAELVNENSDAGEALRDRLARLMAAIEHQTGATVLGLAGDRRQLAGMRFDRELAGWLAVAA